jgi:hypothetical protein
LRLAKASSGWAPEAMIHNLESSFKISASVVAKKQKLELETSTGNVLTKKLRCLERLRRWRIPKHHATSQEAEQAHPAQPIEHVISKAC